MVRAVWLTVLVATLAQAQELSSRNATVDFDTSPQVVDETGHTVAVKPRILDPASLLLTTNSSDIQKRRGRAIDVVIAGATVAGKAIIAKAAADLYDRIADKIKGKADSNSCTMIYATENDDGYYEGYAYYASTTGGDCKSTAEKKTVVAAVEKCAASLNEAGAVMGCCTFWHGGTWHGHLQLTADPKNYPAKTVDC